MPDRLAMDAHVHGHDGMLLLAGYSFAEITEDAAMEASEDRLQTLPLPYPEGVKYGSRSAIPARRITAKSPKDR